MVLAVIGLPAFAQEDPKTPSAATIETIADVWRQRQEAVRTFHFEWDEIYTLTSGALTKRAASAAKQATSDASSNFDVSFFMTMDGDKLRFFQDSIIGTPDGTVRQKRDVASVDGIYKQLLHAREGTIAQGEIQQGSRKHSHVDDPTLLAIAMTLRPFSQICTVFDELTSRFELVSERASINGREYLLLRELPDGSVRRPLSMVWVDPERDFVIVRRTLTLEGKTQAQQDLTEFKRVDPVWIPVKWTVSFLNSDGSTLISRAATVTKYEINHEIDASAFELTFPPGTYVHDSRSSTHNLARTGGELRKLLPAEMGPEFTVEDLLNSEPGELLHRPDGGGRGWLTWILLANGIALLLLVIAILWWRGGRRSANS